MSEDDSGQPIVNKDEYIKISKRPTRKEILTGKTDWDYLDKVTDEEIHNAIMADPNTIAIEYDPPSICIFNPNDMKSLSIRLEQNVITWYKENYKSYRSKISDILSEFMKAEQKKLESG